MIIQVMVKHYSRKHNIKTEEKLIACVKHYLIKHTKNFFSEMGGASNIPLRFLYRQIRYPYDKPRAPHEHLSILPGFVDFSSQ